jgi:hypothetical protein
VDADRADVRGDRLFRLAAARALNVEGFGHRSVRVEAINSATETASSIAACVPFGSCPLTQSRSEHGTPRLRSDMRDRRRRCRGLLLANIVQRADHESPGRQGQ